MYIRVYDKNYKLFLLLHLPIYRCVSIKKVDARWACELKKSKPMLYQLCLKVDYRTPPICVQQFSSPNRDSESGAKEFTPGGTKAFLPKCFTGGADITVDPETQSQQNSWPYINLPCLDKNMTFFITFIFYSKVNVKQDHYVTHLWVKQIPFSDVRCSESTVM